MIMICLRISALYDSARRCFNPTSRPGSAIESRNKPVLIDLHTARVTLDDDDERPGRAHNAQQPGAVAHMASALQVLHEVRENQLAQQKLHDRQRQLYRSESDRLHEKEEYKHPAECIGCLRVSGVQHHSGDGFTAFQENGPPSLTARAPPTRAPILLSPTVTPNCIPRLETDRLLTQEKDAREVVGSCQRL